MFAGRSHMSTTRFQSHEFCFIHRIFKHGSLYTVLCNEDLKLSLEEYTEFTILGFTMIVVQGLLSFYHLKKLRLFLLQYLQQQQ
jgi:hypothetical protein